MDPGTYSKLYEIYKKEESGKSYKKWDDYQVNISSGVANKIASFNPVNR